MLTLVLALAVAQSSGLPAMGEAWTAPTADELRQIGAGSIVAARERGIRWEVDRAQTSPATSQDLADLLYRSDSFEHLRPRLDTERVAGRVFVRSAPQAWVTFGDEGARPEVLTVRVTVHATGEEAQRWPAPSAAAVLPNLSSLGERHTASFASDLESVAFAQGKVRVSVSRANPAAANPGFTEAVAVGSLVRVLQNPSLAGVQAKRDGTFGGRSVPVVAVQGHEMARVADLAAAGVRVERDGYATRLSVGDRWVRLTPFAWTMQTPDGDQKLAICAVNGNDGLVVPLAAVASLTGS
jgi:hypothetical protein